jgi:hypothetical protein
VGSQEVLSVGKPWRGASCAVDLPNPFLFTGQPCGLLKILSQSGPKGDPRSCGKRMSDVEAWSAAQLLESGEGSLRRPVQRVKTSQVR